MYLQAHMYTGYIHAHTHLHYAAHVTPTCTACKNNETYKHWKCPLFPRHAKFQVWKINWRPSIPDSPTEMTLIKTNTQPVFCNIPSAFRFSSCWEAPGFIPSASMGLSSCFLSPKGKNSDTVPEHSAQTSSFQFITTIHPIIRRRISWSDKRSSFKMSLPFKNPRIQQEFGPYVLRFPSAKLKQCKATPTSS